MASLLVRALDLEAAEQPSGFEDVNPASVHAANIEALYAAEITTGLLYGAAAVLPRRPGHACSDGELACPRARLGSR